MVRLFVPVLMLMLAGCGSEKVDFSGQSESPKKCISDKGNRMVWIPAGRFIMGENPQYREEGPPQQIHVNGFWMSRHEVTNAEFAKFVEATNYVTVAERNPPKTPGMPPEMQVPGSAVFNIPSDHDARWWRWEVGAQWRHPSGLGENITGMQHAPVVQISYEDARAYADWAGKELPTEEQWEYAARGGEKPVPEPINAEGAPQANYYQGVFPVKDLGEDGFETRAPVGCFEPNGYGLYDMLGNVWEWTSSPGARADASEEVKVIKGGSYLCAANYCARYRPAARQFQERGLGTNHIGFRLVDNVKKPPSEP